MQLAGVTFILLAALAGACTESTAPKTAEGVVTLAPPDGPSRDYAEITWDDCFSNSMTCHLNGSYMSFDDYTGMYGYDAWDMYDCPRGCSTFPLGMKSTEKVRDALFWVNDYFDCQAVMGWVMARVDTGHLRFYVMQDGAWGDYHPDTGDIHIHTDNFLNQQELGYTLMHEGYHGYFSSSNDTDAENFAHRCFTPF